MNDNSITLDSYEKNAKSYIENTRRDVVGDNKDWLDRIVALLSKKSRVLELGSAFGRDATYLESKGINVTCSDAVVAFVDYLQEQGHKAKFINILSDKLTEKYDLILANMVFLHFEEDEFEEILKKIVACLDDTGLLAFSVREGDGERWLEDKIDSPRYIKYWTINSLQKFITKHNYQILDIRKGDSTNPDKIYVIAKIKSKQNGSGDKI